MTELRHPGIVTIVGSNVEVSPPYYVMPRFAMTLRELVNNSPNRVAPKKVIEPILAALSYCHSESVIHRDLHPNNILFDGSTFYVSDFSLGKRVGVDSLHTIESLMGVRGYAAPEQFEDGHIVDHRADIHAIGSILSFVLTRGENPQTVSITDLPHVYRGIVERCRDPKPARRYQSTVELHDDLERVWNHQVRSQVIEKLRGLDGAAVDTETVFGSLNEWTSVVSDAFQTIVNVLSGLPDEKFTAVIADPRFQPLFNSLVQELLKRRKMFTHLDPAGNLLVRIATLTSNIELAHHCGIALLQIGNIQDQFSYARFYRRLEEKCGRFAEFDSLLSASLLTLPEERAWLATTERRLR
jgi:serine/threonine protein kinase